RIIRTEALRDQQMRSIESLDPIDAWWFTLLSEGVLPRQPPTREEFDEDSNPRRALSRDLYDHARKSTPGLRHQSDNALSRALHERGWRPYNYGGGGWEFPRLDELREKWTAEKMLEHDWGDGLVDWQSRIAGEPSITIKKAEDLPPKPQPNGNGHR